MENDGPTTSQERRMAMRVPNKCMGCSSDYTGGTAKADKKAKSGDHAEYACGSTWRCREVDGELRSITRNCPKHNRRKKD